MSVLPLGTDLEYGAQVHASGAGRAIRRELGIAQSDFVIFTGGKLTPFKRTETLIEAVNALDRADVHLLVAGAAGPNEAEYFAGLEQMAFRRSISAAGRTSRASTAISTRRTSRCFPPASRSFGSNRSGWDCP